VNVARDIVVHVPRKAKLRDRDFTVAEAEAILTASLVPPPARMATGNKRARRWIPWLSAYTGARVNELSQLRGQDVRQIEGIWAIRITPEAGTQKVQEARIVPLHRHIIEQSFLAAIAPSGDGPIFYDPVRQRVQSDDNRHVKKVGEKLATWARSEVGITDTNVKPMPPLPTGCGRMPVFAFAGIGGQPMKAPATPS
jgi:integrase